MLYAKLYNLIKVIFIPKPNFGLIITLEEMDLSRSIDYPTFCLMPIFIGGTLGGRRDGFGPFGENPKE